MGVASSLSLKPVVAQQTGARVEDASSSYGTMTKFHVGIPGITTNSVDPAGLADFGAKDPDEPSRGQLSSSTSPSASWHRRTSAQGVAAGQPTAPASILDTSGGGFDSPGTPLR
jgi:hypothetical protein